MTKPNKIVEVLTSSEDNLIGGLLIYARKRELFRAAIFNRIAPCLEEIAQEVTCKVSPLTIKFEPTKQLNEKGDRIDWGFSFLISSKDGKKDVKLIYIFEKWDLADLFYGVDANATHGVPVKSIFRNPNENWPYGWEWFDGYRSWDGEGIANILEQIKNDGINSDFAKQIMKSIIDAAELCKASCV